MPYSYKKNMLLNMIQHYSIHMKFVWYTLGKVHLSWTASP